MKIALIAPFGSFADSYSLSHVVCDQARALLARGHTVEVWCFTGCVPANDSPCRGIMSVIRPCIGAQKFERDRTEDRRWRSYADDISVACTRLMPDVIITHDALFQADYIDIAKAIHKVCQTEPACAKAKWFHVAHSDLPAPPYKPAEGCAAFRRTLPPGHKVIYPNASKAGHAAQWYGTDPANVVTCPNPHDPRTVWRLSDDAAHFVSRFDLLTADIVQVYAACATRRVDKGVGHLLRIFGKLKAKGLKVRLILALANMTNVEIQSELRHEISDAGLTTDEVIVPGFVDARFTQETPHSLVCELARLSDVFLFTSAGEACPLTLIEAMQSGCLIGVNTAVPAMMEYKPPGAIEFLLPHQNNIAELSMTTKETANGVAVPGSEKTITGEAAYDRQITTIAEATVNGLSRSHFYHSRKTAFRTFSTEAIGARLDAIFSL